MTPLFKSFIPAEFLESWTRGQYVIGPRTLDYQYAGLALILRGFYRYDVWEQGQDDKAGALFGGYAVAYVRDNELNFAGFRLYARDVEGEQTPLFWKSVFSRFVQNVDDKTELYFPYHVFMEGQISHDEATCEGINSFAKSAKGHHEYLDKPYVAASGEIIIL